jgi:hypothetical protein
MPVFKYRDGHNQVVSLRADRCSGLFTQNISYEEFYWKGKKVAQVATVRLLPGYKEKASRLYAKPWRDKLKALKEIHLHERDTNDYGGLPKDAERVWGVNGDRDTWVIECAKRSILHIMNNPEVARRGAFKEALKKLFPRKSIKIYYPTVRVVEVQVQ